MALIACPECKKDISSTVFKCPHCGFAIKIRRLNKKLIKLALIVWAIALILIVFIIIIVNIPPDHYAQGNELLKKNDYIGAAKEYSLIQKNNKHFSQKDALLNNISSKLDTFYLNIIKNHIDNLNKDSAIIELKNLQNINPNTKITEDGLKNAYNDLIRRYVEDLNKAEANKNYLEAVEIATILLNVEEYREDALFIINKDTELIQKKEKTEYKKNATFLSYGEMLRNPNRYINQVVTIRGEISQKIDGGFMMNTKWIDYVGFSGNIVLIQHTGEGVVEEDKVEVLGPFLGLKSYTTVLGAENTIPFVLAKYVTVVQARE